MRRVRVEALGPRGSRLPLDPASAHHLLVVSRHARKEPLVLFDGHGSEADAVLVEVGAVTFVEVTSEIRAPRGSVALHLVLGLPKGPALDQALRMAVEVGVTHVHPALTARSVPRGERGERWERIVVGAAEQCGRADVPTVLPLVPLAEAVARLGPDVDRRVATPGAERLPPATGPAALAVGPEGGWTARELEELVGAGWAPAGLGPHVLRADTAVAVGLALTRP